MPRLEPYEHAQFTARALGGHKPAIQDRGTTGVCGSGWTIDDNETGRELERGEVASHHANRREWAGTIRAIRGVMESASTPAGASVEIIMRNASAADLLNTLLRGGGRGARSYADGDLWAEVVTLAKEKQIRARATAVREGADKKLEDIKLRIAAKIEEKRAEIGPELEAQTALPPKKKW